MAKQRYIPRMGLDIRIKPDGPKAAKVKVELRPCEIAGCKANGEFRVPKSRDDLSTYQWLCQTHAREHNEKWDYFAGMTERDIQKFRVEAVVGHRPTWPLGKRAAGAPSSPGTFRIEDGYAVFGDAEDATAVRRPERMVTRLQQQAFDILNLDTSATLIEIKARYKELVKRFHPDANGGDRGAEERLKQVIKAYGVLRASGLT